MTTVGIEPSYRALSSPSFPPFSSSPPLPPSFPHRIVHYPPFLGRTSRRLDWLQNPNQVLTNSEQIANNVNHFLTNPTKFLTIPNTFLPIANDFLPKS